MARRRPLNIIVEQAPEGVEPPVSLEQFIECLRDHRLENWCDRIEAMIADDRRTSPFALAKVKTEAEKRAEVADLLLKQASSARSAAQDAEYKLEVKLRSMGCQPIYDKRGGVVVGWIDSAGEVTSEDASVVERMEQHPDAQEIRARAKHGLPNYPQHCLYLPEEAA